MPYPEESLLSMDLHQLPNVHEVDVANGVVTFMEAEKHLDDSFDAIEAAMQVVMSLESIADDLLSQIIDRDGGASWSHEEQRMLDITLDTIYSGGLLVRPDDVGLEAFADRTLAQHLQTVRAHAVRILEAILQAVKRALQLVGDYIHNAISMAGYMAVYARRLEIETRKHGGEPEKKSYKDKTQAKRLWCPEGRLIPGFQQVVDLVFSAVHVANGPIAQEMEHLLRHFHAKQIAHLPDLAKVLSDNYRPAFAHVDGDLPYPEKHVDMPDDCTLYETDILMGNMIGLCIMPTTNRALHHFDFNIVEIDEATEADEVDVSDLSTVRHLLRMVNNVCAGIHVFEKEQRKFEYLAKDLEILKHAIQNAGDLDAIDKDILRCVGKIAPKIISGLHKASFSYAIRTARSILTHCKNSIEQYPLLTA